MKKTKTTVKHFTHPRFLFLHVGRWSVTLYSGIGIVGSMEELLEIADYYGQWSEIVGSS